MKRIIIALCLLLPLLIAPTAQAATTLMMATDIHYIAPELFEGSDLLAESARYGDGKTPHLSAIWLEGLVRAALAEAPDALIIAGDMAYNGEVISHRDISAALARIQAAGIPVLAMPGNHDLNNGNAYAYLPGGTQAIHSLPPDRYAKYYGAFGPQQAFSADDTTFSYAVAIADDLWIIMLEAGLFEPEGEPFGLVTAETQAWLEAVLAQGQAAGVEMITVTHQSLLPHSEVVRASTMILNWEAISGVIASYGVRLNLSGHLHIQHIAQRDGLVDASLAALSNHPNLYAMIAVGDDRAIAYEARPLAAAWLPQGAKDESAAFFAEVNARKIRMALRDVQATEAQKDQMIAYAAWMNAHFYGGTSALVANEAAGDPALALWQALAPASFWDGYLREMLAVEMDMTQLTLFAP